MPLLKLARIYYPRSFVKLLLIGFVVVAAPLVVALVNAAISVQRFAGMSERAVDQAAQAARGSRLLVEQAQSLERVVRQYAVLDDAGLLDDYDKIRAPFQRTADELARLPLDERQRKVLGRALAEEARLYGQLSQLPIDPADRAKLATGYVDLSALAHEVLNASNLMVDRGIESMRAAAQDTQRTLMVELAASFVLGILIAVLIAFLIARPIRQLDRAIRRIGAADFVAPVNVQGPADLRYLGERLDWLRRRLSALDAQKARFLRHVSHELKTPLTALREGSELLADGSAGPVNAQQREILAILQANSNQLQRMIENLLDYQRAVAGVEQVKLAQVDLAEIAKRVIERHKLAASARSVRITLGGGPALMLGDEEKLGVIVDNLVSNAVKFSPEGGEVRVRLALEGREVRLDVVDAGPGVPAADRDKIFDWFFQGERPAGARVQGSGLGLAIAREFALAHGGTIAVVEGPQSVFRVTLPRDATRRKREEG